MLQDIPQCFQRLSLTIGGSARHGCDMNPYLFQRMMLRGHWEPNASLGIDRSPLERFHANGGSLA
jgi:hypothetical protein